MMVVAPNFNPPQIWGVKYTTAYSSLQTAINSVCPTVPLIVNPTTSGESNSKEYADGGVLFHPAGEWTYLNGKLESHVVVPTNLSLFGAGNNKSVLNWHSDSGTESAFGLQVRKTRYGDGTPVLNIKIRDLLLKGDWHTSKSCIDTDPSSFDYGGGNYYKTGFDLEISDCTIFEWGKDGISIIGDGANPWYGYLTFANNNLYACKRMGMFFQGDIRVVSMYENYIGPNEVITTHSIGSIDLKSGYCGIKASSLWNADIRNTCIEGLTEMYNGDYSRTMHLVGGYCIVIDNHYEEATTYGINTNFVRNLTVRNTYRQSNEGYVFENCYGAIIENNTLNYMNEYSNSGCALMLSGNLSQVIVRANSLIGSAAPYGIKFLTVSFEPTYVEQLRMEGGSPLVGSSNRFIRGTQIPLQYKNGVPSDTDFNYFDLASGSSSWSLAGAQIGIQCMNTATGNIHVRTSDGWKTLSYTA